MPCGLPKVLKSWVSRLTCTPSSSKRASSQLNHVDCQTVEVSPFESLTLRDTAINYRGENNLDYVDDQASTLPVSVVQVNVRKQDSFFENVQKDSQIKLPRRPISSDEPLENEDEFVNAILEAQRYKEACAAAEEAAEEESRRRFKHYQDMYYLEKEIQDKVVDAHRKLERLRRSAQEAGFSHLVPVSNFTIPSGYGEDGRNASQDTINRFIHRLDDKELDLLYAARTEKTDDLHRSGSRLKEEI